MNKQRKVLITITYNEMGVIIDTKTVELGSSAQPEPCEDTISRQAAIDELDKGAWGVEWDKALAKSMLENLPSVQPEIPDDARDAFMNLVYDELHSDGDNNRANRIIYAADEYVEYSLAKQSAQPDNQVHLCDSCSYTYPECPSAHTDQKER